MDLFLFLSIVHLVTVHEFLLPVKEYVQENLARIVVVMIISAGFFFGRHWIGTNLGEVLEEASSWIMKWRYTTKG